MNQYSKKQLTCNIYELFHRNKSTNIPHTGGGQCNGVEKTLLNDPLHVVLSSLLKLLTGGSWCCVDLSK